MKMKIKPKIKPLATNTEIDVIKIKTERNSLGVLKTLLVMLLITLQLALFLISYLYFMWFFQSVVLVSLILTLFSCFYVLNTNKNSQSKPIWMIFLLLCFSFGYVIYFISDERVFWAKYKKRYIKILKNSQDIEHNSPCLVEEGNLTGDSKYLYSAGKFRAYTGTQATYFSSGTTIFDDIIKEINNAKSFVFIEFFIISDGVLLNRLLTVLEDKIKQGVDVKIIYDDLGSHRTLKRKTKKYMKKLGIKLVSFNKVLPKFSVLLNYRDHRKIVVIDGKIAYTGGVNLADEYINEKRLYGYWKDTGVKIAGPAVEAFTLMFLRQWEFLTKESINLQSYLALADIKENNNIIVPYADGLEYDQNIGKNVYINMIASAKEKIYIMSPYFVIDDTIKNLLINKAQAGVDVKIILPEIADKKMVYIVSRNNAEKLLEYGIKVFVMKNSFVHAKVVLTELSAVVGSINMDLRSFYQQFECASYLTDKKVLNDINADFNKTINNSLQITNTNCKRSRLYFRVIAGIINILSPFM